MNPAEWPLWANLLAFAAAGVIVWFGGVKLTRTLDALSIKTGLGQAFVGMLLLGGITSLPEVANVLGSATQGLPGLAINNLLGSAAINVLLLAVADAAIGRKAVTGLVVQPGTMMMCALCMMALTLVALAVAIGDLSVLGVGLWSAAICAFSILSFFLASTYDGRSPWRVKGHHQQARAAQEASAAPVWKLAAISAGCAVVIFIAGYSLSETGGALAEQTGMGTGLVGFLLIGLATSLPELSSIVTALGLKRYEMAFGQILGTNFINLSLFLLADAAYRNGPVINELGAFEIALSLMGVLMTGVFLVGLLERRDRVIGRMGYDSLIVILVFAAGTAALFSLA